VEECPICRKHYLRLAAADRMLGLVVGGVKLTDECLQVAPGGKDDLPEALAAELESAGRAERVAALREIARRKTVRRRKILVGALAVVVLIAAGFGAATQPSPVKVLAGGAARQGSYIVATEAGEVTLCDGARVKLAAGTVAAFRCAWRWESPTAELVRGGLNVVEGNLEIMVDGAPREVVAGGSAEAAADGKISITRPK
jgi:ferric-dicitrate binding protein FerR (iron transport regulator)